jgi:serine/threonine protein kinase
MLDSFKHPDYLLFDPYFVECYGEAAKYHIFGKGWLGTVVKAEHTDHNRNSISTCAIKLPTPSLNARIKNVSLRDEQIPEKLRGSKYILHRNFVPEQHDENHVHPDFISMPVCSKLSLFLGYHGEYSSRKMPSRYSLTDILYTLHDIANGLIELEDAGFVYSDIKLENFGVINYSSKNWRTVIVDLGNSGVIDCTENPNVNFSSVAYIPPENRSLEGEKSRSKAQNSRSSIWKYGILMYELLSGREGFYEGLDSQIRLNFQSEFDQLKDNPIKSELLRQEMKREQLKLRGTREQEMEVIHHSISKLLCDSDLKSILFNCLEYDINRRELSLGEIIYDIEKYQLKIKSKGNLSSRLNSLITGEK